MREKNGLEERGVYCRSKIGEQGGRREWRADLKQEQDSNRREGRIFMDLVMEHEIVLIRLLTSNKRVHGHQLRLKAERRGCLELETKR